MSTFTVDKQPSVHLCYVTPGTKVLNEYFHRGQTTIGALMLLHLVPRYLTSTFTVDKQPSVHLCYVTPGTKVPNEYFHRGQTTIGALMLCYTWYQGT